MATPTQTGFQEQIKRIVSDAGNNFQTLRGQNKPGTDVANNVFDSEIQIEVTTENNIWKAEDGWIYSTLIADNVKLIEAKEICDQ